MEASPPEAPVQLLVVDDHPLVREALVQLLCAQPRWQARGVARADEALALARAGGPPFDALLVDYRLPMRDGLALLAELAPWQPRAARVLMSGADDARLGALARQMGLAGYLPKSLEPADWVAALAEMLAGRRWFPRETAPPGPSLTERQRAVLRCVCEGLSNKQIARELGVAERTVKDHLTVVFVRLGASTRAEAVARAGALGLIELPA